MKKAKFFMLTLSASIFMVACGGGSTETTETAEATTEETAAVEAVNYTVDVANSVVKWKGEVAGVYGHEGTVNLSEGTLSVQDGKVSAGNFTIDMTSLAATDENYNEEEGKTKENLIGHLSSPDFFDVEANPTATFAVKSTNEAGNVVGDLTIRGVTKEAEISNVNVGEGTVTGDLTFNRQDFGIAWAMQAKDMILSDDIQLTIEIATAQ